MEVIFSKALNKEEIEKLKNYLREKNLKLKEITKNQLREAGFTMGKANELFKLIENYNDVPSTIPPNVISKLDEELNKILEKNEIEKVKKLMNEKSIEELKKFQKNQWREHIGLSLKKATDLFNLIQNLVISPKPEIIDDIQTIITPMDDKQKSETEIPKKQLIYLI